MTELSDTELVNLAALAVGLPEGCGDWDPLEDSADAFMLLAMLAEDQRHPPRNCAMCR